MAGIDFEIVVVRFLADEAVLMLPCVRIVELRNERICLMAVPGVMHHDRSYPTPGCSPTPPNRDYPLILATAW